MDHSFGDVEAMFVFADEASQAIHPAEGLLDDPALRQHLEPGFLVGSADYLDNEVTTGGRVHQAIFIIAAIREEVLEPRPASADRRDDLLGTHGPQALTVVSDDA